MSPERQTNTSPANTVPTNTSPDNVSKDNEQKSVICVTCPKGCHLTVDLSTNTVTGNGCRRGEVYGLAEVRDPKRIVTTTVRTIPAGHTSAGNASGNSQEKEQTMLPVRSREAIPKRLLFDAMKEINRTVVTLPVHLGQTIISNICGTGVDIIASRDL